jgi:hypothetical protein
MEKSEWSNPSYDRGKSVTIEHQKIIKIDIVKHRAEKGEKPNRSFRGALSRVNRRMWMRLLERPTAVG